MVGYYPAEQASNFINHERLMALICCSQKQSEWIPENHEIHLPLPELGGNNTIEVWLSGSPVVRSSIDGIDYCTNGEYLFGTLLLHETTGSSLEELSKRAYQRVLTLVESQRFPHLLRMWNYFPGINENSEVLERYRAFCAGRHQAFAARQHGSMTFPAATAIGTHGNGILIYFLASKTLGEQIENPRQMSAFNYPESYGPKPPSFSRAIMHRHEHRDALYVSGTASVVGHETRHPGDVLAQLEETVANLQALIDEARGRGFRGTESLADSNMLKVYLRRSEDYPAVSSSLDKLIGNGVPRLFLNADICRSDLLVEIDALFSSASA